MRRRRAPSARHCARVTQIRYLPWSALGKGENTSTLSSMELCSISTSCSKNRRIISPACGSTGSPRTGLSVRPELVEGRPKIIPKLRPKPEFWCKAPSMVEGWACPELRFHRESRQSRTCPRDEGEAPPSNSVPPGEGGDFPRSPGPG